MQHWQFRKESYLNYMKIEDKGGNDKKKGRGLVQWTPQLKLMHGKHIRNKFGNFL